MMLKALYGIVFAGKYFLVLPLSTLLIFSIGFFKLGLVF